MLREGLYTPEVIIRTAY
jgi:hypothetical protein